MGKGRSGTTWLLELINHSNDYRIVFEPLHGRKVPEWKQYTRSTELYVNKDAQDPELKKLFDEFLNYDGDNKWLNSNNGRRVPSNHLVKMVRGNLLGGWLRENYPDIPMIFIIRNPYAVTSSARRKNWPTNLQKRYFKQKPLVKDYLKPYKKQFGKSSSQLEEYAAKWAISNKIFLTQTKDDPGVHIILYENLRANTEEEVTRLFDFLKQPAPKNIKKVSKRVSKTSSAKSVRKEAWREEYSEAEKDTVQSVLAQFEMDHLYDRDGNPL